jgi:hypothetical protein
VKSCVADLDLAASGNLETLKELLQAGAQVDATNEKGQTSL